MANESIKFLDGNSPIHSLVYEVVRVLIELQYAIGEDGQVHYFLTCKNLESSNQDASKNLFPFFSILYHSSLIANTRGSTTAAKAIRDAFCIAQVVANGRFHDSRRVNNAILAPEHRLPV